MEVDMSVRISTPFAPPLFAPAKRLRIGAACFLKSGALNPDLKLPKLR
jgi:hypothetical protein